jgi:hypothetical protein
MQNLILLHVYCQIWVKLSIRDLHLIQLQSSGHKYELQSLLRGFLLLLQKLPKWTVVSEDVANCGGGGGGGAQKKRKSIFF